MPAARLVGEDRRASTDCDALPRREMPALGTRHGQEEQGTYAPTRGKRCRHVQLFFGAVPPSVLAPIVHMHDA